MSIDYLFRFDGAKDNDEFFKNAMKQGIENVYAGIAMQVGHGWIPDFLLVSRDEAQQQCTLTLIELESKGPDALISSRKYLPEKSKDILVAFRNYLDNVLDRCRTTADPRISAIEDLQAFLERASTIKIETACALRSDPAYLEKLPLADQPQIGIVSYSRSSNSQSSPAFKVPSLAFEGQRSLTPYETGGFNRAILILDAVVRQKDHSAARLKGWLDPRRNPLHKTMSHSQDDFPALFDFLASDKNSGVQITFEPFFAELSTFWSGTTNKQVNPDRIH